ncbi:PEP-CTERM protein-sorting domain-containing protein [Nitrosospira multiformis]|uniref:PEP-CTERM protein-sorting domain-containing protein n=1 Tax=Nitrosospira multiformis TaxID=1231 RepID=A0A1H8PNS3_9PROT|nr:PEP-CTERM protein-sorting domain-containing protein [Nitrosospira multiformis]
MNGDQLAALPNLHWDALTPFSVAPEVSFLNPRLNTLTITITSTDTYLEAVRLKGGVSVVPEPSMVLMLMAGLITILVSSRGRSDTSQIPPVKPVA